MWHAKHGVFLPRPPPLALPYLAAVKLEIDHLLLLIRQVVSRLLFLEVGVLGRQVCVLPSDRRGRSSAGSRTHAHTHRH